MILAGGLGHRLGGSKAMVGLNGRPLISYPVQAVQGALGGAVVVAKADTELSGLPGVEVWVEPDAPRHPLTGLVHALERAGGRPVLVCACDLPLVTSELISEIAAAGEPGAAAVVARADGRLQPLLARYEPEARAALAAALEVGASVQDAVTALGPWPYDLPDPEVVFNVNTPEDLLRAGALLAAQPKVKS